MNHSNGVSVLRLAGVCIIGCAACSPSVLPSSGGAPFDGEEYHNKPETHAIGLADVLKWQLHSEPEPWPEWVPTRTAVPRAHGVPDKLTVTFVNHSTLLVQTPELNILTDPVWSERVGPLGWFGPKRHHAPGVRFEDLPHIDAVIISHDHYDHLDISTIERLVHRDNPWVFVGLGNERHLDGVSKKVKPLDWWQCYPLEDTEVCSVPAQHNSRRGMFDANETLWTAYYLKSSTGGVYFAGDTGWGAHFAEAYSRIGAPCVAMLPIGAYLPRWFMAPNHISPKEAVLAHHALHAQHSIAMHFGTFRQADEGRERPARDLQAALSKRGVASFIVPEVGGVHEFECERPRTP